ncbi:hypothetical protein CEP54_010216 [Fusarium duplospermum]|uniref:non-specific serine/threonine protein kinase n=1 Tax=Fusarium duplospermum TaxID=1325734 RepID=A0A428PL64_9HYPO|nr:hypothetical protein CEP54_010216 [Fusarium duplospermum]
MLPDIHEIKPSFPLESWEPLPDPQRPDFPYHSGLTLAIQPHTPPTPFGSTGYTTGLERQEAEYEEIAEFPHSEWCLRYPPAETPPHPYAAETQTLEIVQGIACEDGRGAQIVRCHIGGDKDRSYVAKIYDPLYYSFEERGFGFPVDVTYRADQDYSREAAAFEDLKANGADGRFSPRYYGSWTFDMLLPGTPPVFRPVRLVLMEDIKGIDLWSIMERDGANDGIHTMPPEERLEIFAKAAEAETNLKFHGVIHKDFAPRNVMIVEAVPGEGAGSHTPRVVLIDFNNSACVNRPNFRDRQFYKKYPLPLSPRYLWWGGCPNEFLHWVPDPHRSEDAVFDGWLVQRWPDPSAEYILPPFRFPRHRQMAKIIEYASPVPDTEPVFVQVYSRHYSLSPVSWSSDGGSSPNELGEAKSSRSRDDSGESDPPQSGNGSPRSGSEPDGTSPSQGTLGELEKASSFVEREDHDDFRGEGKTLARGVEDDDMSLLGSGIKKAKTSHGDVESEDSHFAQG